MSLRHVCLLLLGLAGLALLTSGGIAWRNSLPGAAAAETKDTRVKELQKERHTVLQKIADAVSQQFFFGKASMAELIEANQAVLKAELDLCDTDQERIKVLERMLENARMYEKHIKQDVEVGRSPLIELLKATASRLEVEITLERAKKK